MTTLAPDPRGSDVTVPLRAAQPPPTPPPPPPDDLDDLDAGLEQPRELHSRTLDDIMSLAGAAVGSLALVWLLYDRILPLQGVFGFAICWYLAFLVLYTVVTAMANPRPVVTDRLASAVMHGGAAVVGIALVSTVVFTFVRGGPALLHLNMYTRDMAGVRPQAPLDQGGVLHAIVGSLIEIGIGVAVALPLGIGTAVFMTEVGGRLARGVRTIIEAMTALPDIVAGLFIYTVLIISLGFPRSGFPAAMSLAVMMTPIIARSSDVVLRVVPGGLREAGLALGASHWRTVWHVVVPTARPGLATALILGVARAVGETAPVLMTSGASTFFNANPMEHAMNSLPLFAFSAVRSGQPVFIERGFGAASILLAIVLLLFIAARRLARHSGGRR
jgi:phosphate transport system permease protein